jgi:hypothetical protein
MATLIPAFGTCVSRVTSGERRFAERIEQKLDADFLAGYDVPGPADPRSKGRLQAAWGLAMA